MATQASSATKPEPSTLSYFPVEIDSIDANELTTDLYLGNSAKDELVLYRSVGIQFTEDDRRRLIEQGITFFYVPMEQHRAYRQALARRLDRLFDDPSINRAERTRIVRASCSRMIEEVLLFPNIPANVAIITDIARQFAEWSAERGSDFSYLMDMSNHDFYTVTHMLNTGVACGLLIRELVPNDVELHARFIQGAMLHDVGKRGVPESILNKEGRLDPADWDLIRAHPMIGYNELKAHVDMPEIVLEMTRDHHESLDGSGYPNGVTAEKIGFAARVCRVVDVFDAITAARPYRGPTPPAKTLEIMNEASGKHFDADILKTWNRIVMTLLSDDPARAATGDPGSGLASFSQFQQAAPLKRPGEATRGSATPWQDDRRRHPRISCNSRLRVRFHHQGKAYPIAAKEWMTLRTFDVGRGGMQLLTPWPLSLNDILEVELPAKKGTFNVRRACVVRVRQSGKNQWMAGMSFIEPG